jgi:uncharacterized membrane protein
VIATVVDIDALVKVVWVSLVGGIGVCTAFSLLVLGLARASDARREGRTAVMVPWYGLAVLSVLIVALGVWQGYLFVVRKS